MTVLTLDKIDFTWEELVKHLEEKRSSRKKTSESMLKAAESAYALGVKILALKTSFAIYNVNGIDAENYTLHLFSPIDDTKERLFVGPRIGYLFPAREIAIAVSTAGSAIADAISQSAAKGDYLMMYYLDSFGVRALASMSHFYHSHIEDMAKVKGFGVGPSMQPGSVEGWEVTGQRDLFRLAHGERIGLRVNEAAFLVPHISNSSMIGMGPHYSSEKIGSMCHECPHRDECLWRRESNNP